jgi:hypothetical protein
MSIVGIRSSSPESAHQPAAARQRAATSYSREREDGPDSISEAFAVVPPMSNAIAFSKPSLVAVPSAATTPGRRPRLEREHRPGASRRPTS